jgi:hypothetical protein
MMPAKSSASGINHSDAFIAASVTARLRDRKSRFSLRDAIERGGFARADRGTRRLAAPGVISPDAVSGSCGRRCRRLRFRQGCGRAVNGGTVGGPFSLAAGACGMHTVHCCEYDRGCTKQQHGQESETAEVLAITKRSLEVDRDQRSRDRDDRSGHDQVTPVRVAAAS